MALNFPASPIAGQTYPSPPVVGLPVYTWDGEKWTTQGGMIGTGYAPIDSPLFVGDPRAPNPAATDNDNSLATTKYVTDAIAAIPPPASAAEFRANSAPTKTLSSGAVWSSAAPVAVSGNPFAPDLSAGFDFIWNVTVLGSTLANPTNGKPGQKGVIYCLPGGGNVTGYGTAYKFPNGVKPTHGGIMIISYIVGGDGTTMYCTSGSSFS